MAIYPPPLPHPKKKIVDTVAKFIVPEWGDIVDSGIGLSYWPVRLCSLVGQYANHMPESTLSLQSGTMNWLLIKIENHPRNSCFHRRYSIHIQIRDSVVIPGWGKKQEKTTQESYYPHLYFCFFSPFVCLFVYNTEWTIGYRDFNHQIDQII